MSKFSPANLADRLKQAIGSQSVNGFAHRCSMKTSTVQNVLHGTMPSADKAALMAEQTNVSLEWLITGRGAMRPAADSIEEHLADETRPPLKEQNLLDMESATQAMVRVIYTAGGNPIPADLRAELLQSTAAIASDDEIKESTGGYSHRHVEVMEIKAAAGGGADVWDETITGYLAFKRIWLNHHNLQPAQCSVIGVQGRSMEPTLPAGCSILVDRNRCKRQAGHIYVLRTEDGLVVKRLEQNEAGWQLISDHAVDYPPVRWRQSTEIIGQVMWAAMMPR